MTAKHEMEIEIDATGEIHVQVVGAKGKQCLQYLELFQTMGQTRDEQKTSEFYEPENKISIADKIRTRIGR